MGDCEFCAILENKDAIMYEDEKLVVVVPEKTVSKGHFRVIPKAHKTSLQDYSDKDVEHFFYAASFAATALFENLQAHGTNILANTGSKLNQSTHFHIDVIARWSEDGLNFLWTPTKKEDSELEQIQGKIKDKADLIGTEKKEKEVVNLDKKPEKLDEGEDSGAQSDDSSGKEKKVDEDELSAEKTESTEEKPSEEGADSEKVTDSEDNYMVKQLKRMP